MCKTKWHGKQLACKQDDTIIFQFENVNGLPTSKSVSHSDKVSSLKNIWSKLNTDFESPVENYVNPSLFPNKDSLRAAIFQNHAASSMLSNNVDELIGKR